MKKEPKNSAIGRREFLAATSGLLAVAVPGGEVLAHAANSAHSANSPFPGLPAAKPSGNLRKIPIGVFDPVYEHLSLDAMLDKVTALGLEAMEIGTGGYPNNHHCPWTNSSPTAARPRPGRKSLKTEEFASPRSVATATPFIPMPSMPRKT